MQPSSFFLSRRFFVREGWFFGLLLFFVACSLQPPKDQRSCKQDGDCASGSSCLPELGLCSSPSHPITSMEARLPDVSPDAQEPERPPEEARPERRPPEERFPEQRPPEERIPEHRPPEGSCKHGENRICYTGSDGTQGNPPCKSGMQRCVGGQWGPCDGEVTPKTEICKNGIDEDCDGTPDNGCECNTGDTQPCYSGAQKTKNVGVCKEGTKTCDASGKWGSCQGQLLPKPEICKNGLDEDCDGTPDNGCECNVGETRSCYEGPPGTQGKGICKSGTQTCDNFGKWGTCTGQVLPSPENCSNATDDNCDGRVDNCVPTLSPCRTDENCADGRFCLLVESEQRCYQGCSSNSFVCASNTDKRTTCLPVAKDLQGRTQAICIELLFQKGTSCDQKRAIFCDPFRGLFCDSNLGKCEIRKLASVGNPCDPPLGLDSCSDLLSEVCRPFGSGYPNLCVSKCGVFACPSGYACLHDASLGKEVCFKKCTPGSCGPGMVCLPPEQGSNDRYCHPNQLLGPQGYGFPCDLSQPATKGCKQGYSCHTQQGSTKGICTQACSATNPCPSAGGTRTPICSPAPQGAPEWQFCLFPCTTSQDCPNSSAGIVCKTKAQGGNDLCSYP